MEALCGPCARLLLQRPIGAEKNGKSCRVRPWLWTSPAEQQTLPLYGELRLRARPTMTSLIAVSSYTDTDILAHTPKGAENDQGIT